MQRIDDCIESLERRYPPNHRLRLEVAGRSLSLRSNSERLVEGLARYFGEIVVDAEAASDAVIVAIEAPSQDFGLQFRDWPREPGKRGKKEAYADLEDGRIVHKVRTGMQFLLGRDALFVVGPCIANENQVINFINAQYLAHYLHEGWALCHGAGVCRVNSRTKAVVGLGIAARAGAGKSTLALHLMSRLGLSFVSNDRLLVQKTSSGVQMAGIPKMPRVNPGTLMNNPSLSRLLPAERRAELERLDQGSLWQLEEKYDVPVGAVYGPGRCRYSAPMRALLVLNWSHDAPGVARFEKVTLAERPDLLQWVMKSPGVFHLEASGRHRPEDRTVEPEQYLAQLSGTIVVEASGRADFAEAVAYCSRLLED